MKRIGLVLVFLGAACAKFPDTGGAGSTTRLVVSATMAQSINPNYVYIFAFRPTTQTSPTDSGPIPVIAPPWGNGFVAGNCTYFVRWDPIGSPRYTLNRFVDTTLNQSFVIGSPINVVEVPTGGRQFQFELDLTQLAANATDAAALRTLQFNVLTMDRVPVGSSGSKVWDSIGDSTQPSGINNWVNINLLTVGVFGNAFFGNPEPANDVADPSLDIVDWSVEVRRS